SCISAALSLFFIVATSSENPRSGHHSLGRMATAESWPNLIEHCPIAHIAPGWWDVRCSPDNREEE
ncbi:MAG: hypothetical protein WAX32_20450, partial [Raoultella planticola]